MKLPPPPCAVLLVYIYIYIISQKTQNRPENSMLLSTKAFFQHPNHGRSYVGRVGGSSPIIHGLSRLSSLITGVINQLRTRMNHQVFTILACSSWVVISLNNSLVTLVSKSPKRLIPWKCVKTMLTYQIPRETIQVLVINPFSVRDLYPQHVWDPIIYIYM